MNSYSVLILSVIIYMSNAFTAHYSPRSSIIRDTSKGSSVVGLSTTEMNDGVTNGMNVVDQQAEPSQMEAWKAYIATYEVQVRERILYLFKFKAIL